MDVYVKYCDNYENIQKQIDYLLNSVLENGSVVKKGMNVFLKTNALAPHPKERAITTHPRVVEAVIKYFKKYDVNIFVGDNPATKEMKTVYKVNGTLEVVEKENVELA